MNIRPLFLACAVLSITACDAQTDDDYNGEALATVRGTIESRLPASSTQNNPTPADEAALIWINSAGSPDIGVFTRAPVEGSFPANFELEVFTPPPTIALNDYTRNGDFPVETRIGVAFVGALPASFDDATDDPGDLPPGSFGLSEEHVLVYIETDVTPGSFSEELVGGPLKAGFHIMDVIDVDEPSCNSDIFDCLRPASAGMDTEVNIVIDEIAAIDVPNWT